MCHKIQKDKLKILNYDDKSLQLVSNYLIEIKQFVQIEGTDSETLTVGAKSVTQCITLSCLLYLTYILDIPQICHDIVHEPKQYRQCNQPKINTFVDDNYVLV